MRAIEQIKLSIWANEYLETVSKEYAWNSKIHKKVHSVMNGL